MELSVEQGESAASYRWTGWVREYNRLKSETIFSIITDHTREIYGICLQLIKKNRKITTCNPLDLETVGSWPIMPKNLPEHCIWATTVCLDVCAIFTQEYMIFFSTNRSEENPSLDFQPWAYTYILYADDEILRFGHQLKFLPPEHKVTIRRKRDVESTESSVKAFE